MLLEIENLAVEVAGKRVLKDVNLSIDIIFNYIRIPTI